MLAFFEIFLFLYGMAETIVQERDINGFAPLRASIQSVDHVVILLLFAECFEWLKLT